MSKVTEWVHRTGRANIVKKAGGLATRRLSDSQLEHDPEKWKPVLPHDKRATRLREDHAQTTN
jgi:hypothetical protein